MSLRSALAVLATLVLSTASTPSSRSSAAVDGGHGRLRLHVLDEAGRHIVSRVQIEPMALGQRLLSAASSSEIAREHGLSMRLPAGAYRVRVSRGIEWSLDEFGVTLRGDDEVTRSVTLRHQVHVPGFQGADLHVHTRDSEDAASRGGVSSHDLLAEGVELAAVTDHNRVSRLDGEIASVPGAEITTWAPEVGHFNAFPLTRVPRFKNTTPSALVAELRQDPGVFVQVNHPRLQDHIAYFELGKFDGERFAVPGFHLRMDGIEVWNGYDLSHPRRVRALLGEYRRFLARGHRLTATGGSDSHGPGGHMAGYPRTYVATQHSEGLAPALKAGRAFVTNGPLLAMRVDGHGLGERVRVRQGKVHVDVTVQAADWLDVDTLELWADDRLLLRESIPARAKGQPLHFRMRREVQVRGARVLMAVARGGRGLERLLGKDVTPLAFTNPVYLVEPSPH